ncbi:MAG TPA: hypothetical protein VN700_11895 [Vicinamibacterales bacterium]|nr:hypothetical protein [Vicinamibacterales bacterium]
MATRCQPGVPKIPLTLLLFGFAACSMSGVNVEGDAMAPALNNGDRAVAIWGKVVLR